jgi:hypothetical protein
MPPQDAFIRRVALFSAYIVRARGDLFCHLFLQQATDDSALRELRFDSIS